MPLIRKCLNFLRCPFVEKQHLGHCGPAGDPENSPVALEESLRAQCGVEFYWASASLAARTAARSLRRCVGARFASGLTKSLASTCKNIALRPNVAQKSVR
jgi:hypothetical protein